MGLSACRVMMVWVATVSAPAEVRFSESGFPDRHFVPRRAKVVKVDGKLDEWDLAKSTMVIDRATCDKRGIFYTTDPAKQHAKARCLLAWDDEALYVAARIDDDYLAGRPDPLPSGKIPWHYDVLFLRLRAFGRVRATGRYRPKQIMPQASYPQIPLVCYGPKSKPWVLPAGIRYVAVRGPGGWDVEARIAFKSIGFRVRTGDVIRFAWELVDHDIKGSRDVSTSMLWKNWVGFGAPIYLTANEVVAWPELRFTGTAGVSGDVVTDRRYYRPDPTVVIKAEVDALAPGARLDRIELCTHKADKTLQTIRLGRALSANKSTALVARMSGKGLAPGWYKVRLHYGRGASKETAECEFCVQSAKPKAGAVTMQAPGVFDFQPRWQLAENPTRWWYNAADKMADTHRVTRDDYSRLLQELIKADWDAVHGWFGPKRANRYMPYGMHNNLPLIFYVLYQETGEKVWGERTVETLKTWHRGLMKDKKCWFTGHMFADVMRVWRGLKKQGLVTDQDENTWWKETELAMARLNYTPITKAHLEYGAMNRSMSVAAYLGYIAKRYPDYPEAAAYEKYYQTVWNQWWPFRDGDENSSNYNTHFLDQVLASVTLRGHDEIFQDAGFRKYCERLLLSVAPCGTIICFGDDQGMLSSMKYVGLFEQLATRLKDGRYRAAAQRLFDFRRELPWRLHHFERHYHGLGVTRTNLAQALYWSRGDKTQPRHWAGDRCRVLTRKLAEPTSISERKRTAQWFRMTDKVVPDKLILASGSGVNGLYATVELCPQQGHGHPTAPAVNGMLMFQSAILGGIQYVRKQPEWHNLLWIEDLEGVQSVPKIETITVPTFLDQGRAAFAHVDVEPYKAMPVRNRRSIWFVKDRFVWVRDEAHYRVPFLSRVGPVWNTRCVAPEVGEHWANTYIDMCVRGPLTGARDKPFQQCHPEPNYNWDLLVWFLPQPDRHMTIKDRSLDDPYLCAPQRVRYAWQGMPTPGRALRFDTVLMPHEPGPRAKPFVDRIKVLVNADKVVALEVNYEVRSHNRRRDEVHVLVWNTGGGTVAAGGIETDAAQAYVALPVDKKTKQAKIGYAWVRQGKTLTYKGKALLKKDKPTDWQQTY